MILAFLILFLTIPSNFWTRLAACLFFLLAVGTDLLDGLIARRSDRTSQFGALTDPIADKILILMALLACLGANELVLPMWPVTLIVAREFIMMGIRLLALTQGRLLTAERWGKWKMGCQVFGTLLLLLALLATTYEIQYAPSEPWLYEATQQLLDWVWIYLLFMCAVTWATALVYLRKNWQLLKQSWIESPKS
ncbi:MAG: CDP-alcohol phosphatidyltransferase family protein [Elusimicrobia bacterium]|nr:CDP-alcohol phosphatidyltransferase family protein [Elusimicrobiota bacterium]